MSNTSSTPSPFGEVSKFPPGYGTFPYLILRLQPAVYMQIPIQLEAPDPGAAKKPGMLIPNISKEQLAEYAINLDSALHDLLVLHFRMWKQKTEFYNKGVKLDCCLVEAPNRGYYFKGKEEHMRNSIPKGGTLLNLSSEVIAMNVAHFITLPNS